MSESLSGYSKEISLTKGKIAIVDAEDFEFLSQWKWHAAERGSNKFYATRSGGVKNGNRHINMHNALMNPPKGMEVDHINGNSLDNRRSNLRVCTHKQNRWNSRPQKESSSKYKGVSYQKATDYYKAYIIVHGQYKHLGCYVNEDDAARAYNKAAKVEHGEFAVLNPVEGEPPPSLVHPTQHAWHKAKAVNYV